MEHWVQRNLSDFNLLPCDIYQMMQEVYTMIQAINLILHFSPLKILHSGTFVHSNNVNNGALTNGETQFFFQNGFPMMHQFRKSCFVLIYTVVFDKTSIQSSSRINVSISINKCEDRVRQIVGSNPGWVTPKTRKLACIASPLSTQH